jgi:hypothetical protein
MIAIIQDSEFKSDNYNVHITIVQGYVRQTLSVEALEVRNSNEETQKKIDRKKRITTQRKRSRCRKVF